MSTTTTTSAPGSVTRSKNPFLRIGGRYSWMAMGFLWVLFAFNANFRAWAIGSLQPSIVKEFNVDATTIGLFAGFITLAQGIVAIPITAWMDRGGHGWARKYRYAPIILGYTLLTLATGFNLLTGTLLALFVIQFLQKALSGTGEAAEVTIISEWWPVQRRGFAQGLHHTSYPWGTFIGGLAVAGMLSAFGEQNWRYAYLFGAILIIPVFIGYWVFSSRARYAAFEQDTIARGLTLPLGATHEEHVPAPKGAVWRAFRNPNVVITSIVLGLGLAVYTGISFWLPLYLAFVSNYSLAATAGLSVVFTITGGIGQILWGSVSDRIGRKFTLVLLFIWLALGTVLLQFVGVSIVLLIVLQLFVGLATNGIFPILYAMAADSIEPGAIGIAMGFNVAGQMLGGLGPIVIGVLITAGGGYSDPTGFFWALWVMAAAMIACAVIMALLTRETIGWFKPRDRALVSRERALQGPER